MKCVAAAALTVKVLLVPVILVGGLVAGGQLPVPRRRQGGTKRAYAARQRAAGRQHCGSAHVATREGDRTAVSRLPCC